MPKPKLLLPVLVLIVLLALPAGAGATLAYVKNPLKPTVFVAEDDGSRARKIGIGRTPHVSPDGQSVVFLHEGPKNSQEMKLASVTGETRILTVGWRESSSFAWSPDSKKVLALKGPEIGKRRLTLIHVASGEETIVARGYFSGFSFSPDGSELVYARAGSEKYPPRSDIYRRLPGGQSVRLTDDRRSTNPLWGPKDRIVFVKTVDGKKRRYGPKNELFLMDPRATGVKRLTNTKVPPLLQGLFPTDWSSGGSRLLTEFQGQDTSYAVTVNPKTGAQRPLAGTGETGFVGTALSVNGKFVLGYTGGSDPGSRHNVVSIPYGGGRATILAKNAFEPDWTYYEFAALSG